MCIAPRHQDLTDTTVVGVERVAESFRVVPYELPRGSVAGYYPELNVLVPLSTAGELSDTPTSKSVLVSFRLSGKAQAA